jgi:hypothetical protein
MVELSIIRDLVAIFGVIAGFSYYVLTVRNAHRNQQHQLETRQAQLFSQYHLRFNEDFDKYNKIVMDWEYENVDDFDSKYGRVENPVLWRDFLKLTSFLEGLGVLVKRDLTSIELVNDLMSGFIVRFWEKYKPYTLEIRTRYDWPNAYEHIEYLYGQIEPLHRIKFS